MPRSGSTLLEPSLASHPLVDDTPDAPKDVEPKRTPGPRRDGLHRFERPLIRLRRNDFARDFLSFQPDMVAYYEIVFVSAIGQR
ncbi:hypothetical protein [Pendulispora brunnea]|uniref:hypothetical protein n=1 Tax=Pendulispora brunnea TaxID=2905690 RepID=UPI00374E0FE9